MKAKFQILAKDVSKIDEFTFACVVINLTSGEIYQLRCVEGEGEVTTLRGEKVSAKIAKAVETFIDNNLSK